MPIKTIVFDLGGVLVDWNPRYLFEQLIEDPDQLNWFLDTVCSSDWNLEQDRGRSFADAIQERQIAYPAYKDLIAHYYTHWENMLGESISGSVALLEELKRAGYALYALTNWSAETFPIARRKFEFFRQFDGIVVSGEEQLVKPEPALFIRFLNRYQVNASTSVYIDDTLEHVEAARKLGFHAIRFTSAICLRNQLEKWGVLSDLTTSQPTE